MGALVRIWQHTKIENVKQHLLIVGDVAADCASCRELGIKYQDAQTCPQCGVDFKFITVRNATPQAVKRVMDRRPDLTCIDYSDYKRLTGKQSARDLFGSFIVTLLLMSTCVAWASELELTRVKDLIPDLAVDLKYKTAENFMGEVLYPEDFGCYLRPRVAQKLKAAQATLKEKGYGLLAHDCYRPLSVQKRMFARFPQPGYVADPAKGSNHNRGAAMDVTLIDLQGNLLEMPSDYDEFTERAHRDYMDCSPAAKRHRQILEDAMVQAGFRPLSTEWWHFDDSEAKSYAVLDTHP